MPILGIGVDLVHVPRIAKLLARRSPDRFAQRILGASEYVQWKLVADDTTKRVQFLAVRWCVKEAAYKALYPILKPTWKELVYHGMSDGRKPTLQYRPVHIENKKKVGHAHVSVSHDGEYIYSSVVIEGK